MHVFSSVTFMYLVVPLVELRTPGRWGRSLSDSSQHALASFVSADSACGRASICVDAHTFLICKMRDWTGLYQRIPIYKTIWSVCGRTKRPPRTGSSPPPPKPSHASFSYTVKFFSRQSNSLYIDPHFLSRLFYSQSLCRVDGLNYKPVFRCSVSEPGL